MYTIRTRLHLSYGHRLMDYDGKCARPHGHNGIVEIEVAAPTTDRMGMVRDFDELERVLRGLVEHELDHQMLLREDDPLVGALRSVGEEPRVMRDNPTAENIARLIYERARAAALPVAAVRLWESRDSMAEYREE